MKNGKHMLISHKQFTINIYRQIIIQKFRFASIVSKNLDNYIQGTNIWDVSYDSIISELDPFMQATKLNNHFTMMLSQVGTQLLQAIQEQLWF